MKHDFTLVLGVDRKTLEQLKLTLPTWIKHKPELFDRGVLVFRDRAQVSRLEVCSLIETATSHYRVVDWDYPIEHYPGKGLSKWDNPQREKMLSGFVHIPAKFVHTPYWMKLDTDVVAHPYEDPNWISPDWFLDFPSIIAPSWGYTKPADQMQKLDQWAEHNSIPWMKEPLLNLVPKPEDTRINHHRICSWGAFFNTPDTAIFSSAAERSCGKGRLPVYSQDGFMFYCAKRAGRTIRTIPMKQFGWDVCGSLRRILQSVERSQA